MMADGAAGGETVIAIHSGLPMQQPRPPRRIAAAERAGISAELESGALLQRSYVGRQRFGLQRRQRCRRRQGDHIGGALARQAPRPIVEAGRELGAGGFVITPIAAPQIAAPRALRRQPGAAGSEEFRADAVGGNALSIVGIEEAELVA